jgi:uncharacterized membrane protein YdbT with pleckstrin-like domain
MSGIIVLIVALLLLVIAAYNLVSYIRDRRQSGYQLKIKAIELRAADNSIRMRQKTFCSLRLHTR